MAMKISVFGCAPAALPWLLFGCILLGPGTLVQSQTTVPLTVEGYSVESNIASKSFTGAKQLTPPFMAVIAGPFLTIYDDSNPAAPTVVSSINAPSDIRDVAAYDNKSLLIADGPSGLLVYNFTDPYNPTLSGALSKYFAQSVAVSASGGYAYLASADPYIRIVKLTDPAHPHVVNTKTLHNATVYQLLVAGSTNKVLLAAAGGKGIEAFSLRHPRKPKLLSKVKAINAVGRIAVLGKLVAATDAKQGLVLISYPSWDNPRVEATMNIMPRPVDCAIFGSEPLVLAGQGTAGYTLVDASTPSAPVIAAQSSSPAPVQAVAAAASGWGGYLLCGKEGFWSLNVADPSTPAAAQLVSGAPGWNVVTSVGDIVYASQGSEVIITDLNTFSGSFTAPGFVNHLLIYNGLLFVSCAAAGLAIYNLSPSFPPTLLSVLPTTGAAGQVSVNGDLMAVASGDKGVDIVDITDPSNPSILGTWNAQQDSVVGVGFASQTILWVAQTFKGITALDLTNPTTPKALGTINYGSNYGDVVVSGDYLYEAAFDSGIRAVKIADPKNPKTTSEIKTGYAYGISLQGNVLLVSNGQFGLREFDLANPAIPAPVRVFESPGFCSASTLLADGERVTASKNGGLWVLSLSDCQGADLTLPCDNARLSPFGQPLFTWTGRTGAKYEVKISTDPAFPGKKTFTGKIKHKAFKTPYWIPNGNQWHTILKKGRGEVTLYWRVLFIEGSKSYSATRSFTIY